MKFNIIKKNIMMMIILLFFLSFYTQIWSQSALEFTNANIQKIEELRQSLLKDYSKENQAKVLEESKKLIFNLVDLKEISDLSLGRYLKKIKPVQLKQFRNIFSGIMSIRLVNINLPSKKKLSKKNPLKVIKEYKYRDTIFNKDAYVVFCQIKRRRITYNIELMYYMKAEQFKLYDVKIDDSSTLLDFRNQFNRIIRKKGMDYLIKKLKQKVNQIKKKKKK